MQTVPLARVYCLGHFHIEWRAGAEPADPAQFKPLALLKLLVALGARHVPQERILDSLWPDSEGDAAQTAFNSTLYRLRRLLGQHAVVLRNRQLSLDPAHVWWDVLELESVLGEIDGNGRGSSVDLVERLFTLYRGPLCDGEFEPPEIIHARERLHAHFLRAVRVAGRHAEEAGQLDTLIEIYRKALEIDPAAEEIGQHLMSVLGNMGSTSEALIVYQRLQRTLYARGREVSAQTDAKRAEIERLANSQSAAHSGNVPRSVATVLHASPPSASLRQAQAEATTIRERAAADGSRIHNRRVWLAASMTMTLVILVALAVSRREDAEDSQVEASLIPVIEVPTEPSMVVLPFTNMSGETEYGHFADGLTDTLITDLSRLHKLLVIARNSAFSYKGRAIDVRQVGKELGVRHVLEGSVQVSEKGVRINVQLTEAATGTHLWAERYDRPLADIFLIQDDIASRVVEELDVVLVTGEQARQWRRATRNPAAYSEVLAGRAIQGVNHTIEGMMRSRAHFRRAIELDPTFALPYAYMVSVYQHLTDNGYDAEPDVSYETALKYAEHAIRLNPELPIARAYRGAVLQQLQRYEEALREYRLAVRYGPNAAESLMLSAWGIAAVGDAAEALQIALRAMRLDPIRPGWYWGGLADTYLRLQQWREAIPAFERCVKESIELIWCRAGLTVAYMRAGRLRDAQRSGQEWLRIDPKAKAADNFYLLAWRDPGFRTVLAQSLAEAGL